MAQLKIQESANGYVYTLGGTTVLFPFGADPKLVYGSQLVRVENPARWGAWDTASERRAWMHRFCE